MNITVKHIVSDYLYRLYDGESSQKEVNHTGTDYLYRIDCELFKEISTFEQFLERHPFVITQFTAYRKMGQCFFIVQNVDPDRKPKREYREKMREVLIERVNEFMQTYNETYPC